MLLSPTQDNCLRHMLVVDFVTLIMINNMDHIDNNKFTLKQIGDLIVGAHYLPTRTIYY